MSSRTRWILALLALIFLLLPKFGTAVAAQQTIRVVTDDNYPPFAFKNSQGKLEGIVIDDWRLWEAKTGIKVKIYGMDWGQALSRMRKGEFDVIDTIFKTDERTAYFDFTKPYASIEVPVFFRKGISGITDLASLKGFPVAAKQGDAAVELLRKGGIAPVLLFNNYDEIIEAAKEHKVNVFVMDKPPALYLLNKLGIENDFKMSPPLYVGEFRRAVRKGNAVLLREVEQGFAEVGNAELNQIKNKWYGQTLKGQPYLRNLGYAALVILVVVGLLVGWNRSLTKQVRKRTLDLRESESQLRKSKARLEEAQRIAHVGSWEWVAATDTPTWSKELCAILEVDPDKPVPAMAEQHRLYTADSMDRMNAAVEKAMRTGEPYEIELERVRADGSRRWLLARGEPWFDDGGQLIGLRGTALDITERKQAVQALKESTERLLKAQHVARMGFLDWDLKTDEILLSEETCWLYGLQPGEIKTTSELVARSVHPDDLNRVRQALDRAVQGMEPYDIEHRIVRPNGTILWTHSQAEVFYDAEHKPIRVLGTSIDITARKLAEEARRQSEANYRTLVESASDGIFIVDAEGRYQDVNEQGCRMLGYSREEILGLRIAELVISEEKGRIPEELARLNVGQEVRSEWQLQRKDGTVLPGEVSAIQLHDGRLLGILRDITERKQAEESLRHSEERFRELAETIQEVFWVTDSEKQRMLYISPAYEKIWGRTCQSLYDEPHSWVDAIHPEDRDHVLLAAKTRQIAGTYEEEYRIMRPDGQVRWIQDRAFPVRNAAGQIARVVGVARDITNMKVAEEELHRREEHFRLLIENASDVITVINSQGVMRYQSPSVRRVLGYAPEEIIGKNTFKLIHPEDISTVTAAIQRALATPGATVSAEYRIRHQDGQWHTFHSLGRSISGQTEEGFIVLNSRDLTETRQLEEQFRQVQKMEAIGQLAGGVAHDFNNILAIIIMQAQLTEAARNVPAEVREGVRAIEAAAGRAAGLTRQLLMFSRKQIMQPAELDLNEVVTNLTKMLRRIIGEDIGLQLDLHSSPLMTRADAGMLDQVLLNLAINARDAMPQGGRLHIQTSQKTVDEAMARLHPDATPGSFVWISMSDTGCGIAPENLQRIFEPFFTTKEPGKGTGLGLATVFGIVKQHGGWIKVHSEPGQGTNLQVFLPAIEKSVGETAAIAAPPEPRGGTETILLVEDDDTLRLLTRDTLELHGYRVLEAASGAEAVKLWPQYRDVVALLLTDLVMPGGMTGQQLAIQLQTDQPRLKVIYSSGYSAEIAGRELELHSWEGFLPKPYPPEQLLEIIRQYLDT